MFIGVRDDIGVIVLAQKIDGRDKAVTMAGRKLLITESKWSETEQIISLASWGVRKFQQYALNAPRIEIVVPWKEQISFIHDKGIHPRILVKLLDL